MVDEATFPNVYRVATVMKQVEAARQRLAHFQDPRLRMAMLESLADATARVTSILHARGSITLGQDYVVTAEPG